MENLNLKIRIVDLLEIENILNTYGEYLASYKEEDEVMEEGRQIQLARVDCVLCTIEEIISNG